MEQVRPGDTGLRGACPCLGCMTLGTPKWQPRRLRPCRTGPAITVDAAERKSLEGHYVPRLPGGGDCRVQLGEFD